MRGFLFLLPVALCACLPVIAGAETAEYVGSVACQPCHEQQYESFMANSQKAHSWSSLERMLPKLTRTEQEECFSCHTTGFGKPGGFVSLAQTPDKANLSCEACHGPGSLHYETGDADEIIRKPDVDSCTTCHNTERVRNFKFKPTLYHGGH